MKSKGKGKSKDKSKNKMPIYRHSSLPAKTPKKKRTVKKVKAEIVLVSFNLFRIILKERLFLILPLSMSIYGDL